MAEPFTIDIWSDVVCPFCYLAKRSLELALEEFEHASDVVVAFHAFELDPHARLSYDRPLDELVAHKYDMPVAKAEHFHHRIEAEAAQLGMTWDFSRARACNTFDAHRLITLARDQGKGLRTAMRLFAAYFSEGQLLSDHDTLRSLGAELELSGVEAMLRSNQYADVVRAEEEEALELGISAVPAMLLDGRFMVSGARPKDELLDVLNRAWARRSVS